jgi:hypothetical protein
MNTSPSSDSEEEFDKRLAQCKPEDFDGHTEFYRMTPEQRLDWLGHAIQLISEFKGLASRQKKDSCG